MRSHRPYCRLALLGLLSFASLAALSRTGGIVNLHEAVKLAQQLTAAK